MPPARGLIGLIHRITHKKIAKKLYSFKRYMHHFEAEKRDIEAKDIEIKRFNI